MCICLSVFGLFCSIWLFPILSIFLKMTCFLFSFMADKNCIGCIEQIFFISSSVDKYTGWFYVFAIMNSDGKKVNTQVSLLYGDFNSLSMWIRTLEKELYLLKLIGWLKPVLWKDWTNILILIDKTIGIY